MGPQPMADRPFQSIASDTFKLGTIEDSVEGKVDGVLLTTCRLTGHISAFPILEKGLTAEKAGTIISRRAMWGSFGSPKVIFSDNGPQYAARVAKTMCAQLGITQMRGQAYRSQSNGKAESSGKVLMDELRSILCSLKRSGLSWAGVLPRALYWHHQRVDPATGYSIHEKVFGRQGGYPGPKLKTDSEDQDILDFCKQMDELNQKLIAAVDKAHQSMKAKYNKNRRATRRGLPVNPSKGSGYCAPGRSRWQET